MARGCAGSGEWTNEARTPAFAGDEIILMEDKEGRVIGFEKLNYIVPKSSRLQVAFETLAA